MLMNGYEFLEICADLVIDAHKFWDVMRFQDDDIWRSRVLQLNPSEVKLSSMCDITI